MSRTKEEQETIIRFDQSSPEVTLYTASPTVMGKWKRLGYPIRVKSTHQGQETGWESTCPKRVISFRRFEKSHRKAPSRSKSSLARPLSDPPIPFILSAPSGALSYEGKPLVYDQDLPFRSNTLERS